MMRFMRAAHAQMHQFPHIGSEDPVGSAPLRRIPHFLQPMVSPPPSSILDNSGHKYARCRDEAFVLVRGRKVRITDGASLYSVCRSWLRNGVNEGIQQSSDTFQPLPKLLPVVMVETSLPKDPNEEPNEEDEKEEEAAVKQLSEKDLLERHVGRAKKVRARLREERTRRIAGYKARVALLLPPAGDQCNNDWEGILCSSS
ncbi:PREDICTED: uncharacterized protein LOC104816029 [Tarenaya hassleriana]|uniref:uncharacterized protein LOC104816029 n=1 Tax=Tarenaya hassleriana TaxID=28532 RepID=UPI00053C9A9F|nr:PREDICTED: uncharacterized protein LOC104816029 [Tarenaya hassleriana]